MADSKKEPTLPGGSKKHPHASPLPSQIGPYKIEALLEKGGMSYLYLAIHPTTQEPITIKALFPEFLSNPEMVQRFLREAEIIAMADHPNIVKLYGQGRWEGGLYIAMEFIQGISLRQYLLRNLISLKQALEISMEIAMALCHLHSHGVIHRDLKPENILVTETGAIKVIDFGIAQLLTEAPTDSHSQKRRLIGTPVYMSPEQRENPESTTYPSDLYSLAIITYELVLGKLCHGHIYLSLMPKSLQKILSKALQPKPEERYQDTVDYMTDLSHYMQSPAFEKESKESVPFGALSESLRYAEQCFVPQSAPRWPNIETGFAAYKSLGTSSIYCDFFELPNEGFGIILGDPSIKGSSGIVYASVLRGMVRALCKLTQKPEELATVLNALLIDDPMKQHFAFSYLILLPKENVFRFISCGCGHLWHISKGSTDFTSVISDHPPLGINLKAEFTETEGPLMSGDSVVLYACLSDEPPSSNDPLFTPAQFESYLKKCIDLPPQNQVDSILRKAKINISRISSERSLFIISLLRK